MLLTFDDISTFDMNNENLEDTYFGLLEKTLRQVRKFSQRELQKRDLKISGEQWLVLKHCHEEAGISQRKIAELTFKDPASVTRMIDLLEQRGLIQRKPAKGDRRSHGLYLTEEGTSFVEQVEPLHQEIKKYGLKGISEKDKDTFQQVFHQICENLE